MYDPAMLLGEDGEDCVSVLLCVVGVTLIHPTLERYRIILP